MNVICQKCHSPMKQMDATLYECPKCNVVEDIQFNLPDEEKMAYPFYNKDINVVCESDVGIYCDKCHHPLLIEGNFMFSDRYKTVSDDDDAIGADCHCPYCGSQYSIVELPHKIMVNNGNKQMEKNKAIVINLMGCPGSGKSTVASGIFYQLKKMGINCELALEFAKDKVWEEAFRTMDNQIYIFAKQYHKLWRLRDKVDVIITDSPLLASLYYNKTPSKYFNDFVLEQFNSFDNMTYLIGRPSRYQQEGRIQDENAAKEIDISLEDIMDKYNVDYKVYSCDDAVNCIVTDIITKI